MEARQETATTRNLSPPSMVGRTSEAGKMNRASRGPTIPGTLDRADRPDPRHGYYEKGDFPNRAKKGRFSDIRRF